MSNRKDLCDLRICQRAFIVKGISHIAVWEIMIKGILPCVRKIYGLVLKATRQQIVKYIFIQPEIIEYASTYKHYLMIFDIMMLCDHQYPEPNDLIWFKNLWLHDYIEYHNVMKQWKNFLTQIHRTNWNQLQHIQKSIGSTTAMSCCSIRHKLIHEETMSLIGLRTMR